MLSLVRRVLGVFYPAFAGVFAPKTVSSDFMERLAARIRRGLFPLAKPWRNRYEVRSRTDSSLRFGSVGFWTSVAVGLNDVKVWLAGPPDRRVVRYRGTYWVWAGYCIGLGVALVLLLVAVRYLLFPSWFDLWWRRQPDWAQGPGGEVLFWVLIGFWGIVWPWVMMALHTWTASRVMQRILQEINGER